MNKKKKKILLITLGSLVVLILAVFLAYKFSPVSKFLRRSGVDEAQFVTYRGLTAPNSLFFDFEPADSSDYNKNQLYKGIAHSGNFSAKAFGKNSYSGSVNRNVADIGADLLKQVSVSAWVYVFPVDAPVEASLVFAGFNNSVNLVWKGVPITGKEVPMGKWFKVSGKFDLTTVPFNDQSRFQVYFWNNSNSDMLMDDLYIVLGGPREREGDTVLVDLTRAPYHNRLNYPPYITTYFHKAATGPDLTINGKTPALTALPINNGKGIDDILIIREGNSGDLFSYQSENHSFDKGSFSLPAEIAGATWYLAGRFNGQKDLILAVTNDRLYLYETAIKAEGSGLKKIWEGTIPGTGIKSSYIHGDLDGDRTEELLMMNEDKSWKLVRFGAGKWNELASSAEGGLNLPKDAKGRMKITAGKFLKGIPYDVLLTVYGDGKEAGYDLLLFNKAEKNFRSFYKTGNGGRTIGLDTLKVNDQFFTDALNNVFRYNRDWRFDLKKIEFNDSSFTILSNADFRGYEKDRNPKYSEQLEIIPGTFTGSGHSSVFLIQRNNRSGMMPDETGIYLLQK